MNCTYCLVEGLTAVALPATTAWNGTPVCASCATALRAEQERRVEESRGWTESTRTWVTAALQPVSLPA